MKVSIEDETRKKLCTEVFLVVLKITFLFEVMFTTFASEHFKVFFFLKIIQSFFKFRVLTNWCCYPVIWQHTDSRLTVMPDRSFPLLNLALEPLYFLRANKLVLVSVIAEMTQWLAVTLGQTQPLIQLSFLLLGVVSLVCNFSAQIRF